MAGLITASQWAELVSNLTGGKRIAGALYLHRTALEPAALALVEQAMACAELEPARAEVCKFDLHEPVLSLLDYPGFFAEAFPLLHGAVTVYLTSGEVSRRTYPADRNPPVLHRKEQMLPPDHPDRPRFAVLTAAAEAAGLFDDPAIIGHAAGWEEELAARGLTVVDHALVEAPPAAIAEAMAGPTTATSKSAIAATCGKLCTRAVLAVADVDEFDADDIVRSCVNRCRLPAESKYRSCLGKVRAATDLNICNRLPACG